MRVSAVRYLNTWPLVWGFLYGPQRGLFNFQFDLPAVCAAAVASGEADVGLVPCAELTPLGLDFLPDLGIATTGDVRSILLVSKVPFNEIRTLAADSSSRTSVALVRILLRERYRCEPLIARHAPELAAMLAGSDAALIIGDPALRIEPKVQGLHVMDLGTEWVEMSGLPMVFAVWAGRRELLDPKVAEAFRASFEWGRGRLDEMVAAAAVERGFGPLLVREYLTRHIAYELGPKHLEGLRVFRGMADALKPLKMAEVVV